MKANPKLTALNVELLQVEAEIEKLLDTLSGTNATLLAYANTKIEASALMSAIAIKSNCRHECRCCITRAYKESCCLSW